MLIDYSNDDRAIGIEITAPSRMSVAALNAVVDGESRNVENGSSARVSATPGAWPIRSLSDSSIRVRTRGARQNRRRRAPFSAVQRAVDFRALRTPYSNVVFAASRTKRVTAMLAALAVALLGVLPAEHVHAPEAPGAGESVIHRHVVEAHSSSADSVLGHGDHATARVLSPGFETSSKFAPQQPVAVSAMTVPAPPIEGQQPSMRSGLLPAHSPPPRRLPARAPPAHA